MAPFPFPLPTTSLLTFSNILHDPSSTFTADLGVDHDQSSTFASQLAEATSARTKVYLTLKACQDGSGSSLAVLDAIQGYLPSLQAIISSLDSDLLLPRGEMVFPWRPSLTHYPMSTPTLGLPGIHSEHFFVLLAYALALSNHAYSILHALPIFELESSSSSSGTNKGKGKSGSMAGAAQLTSEDEKRITNGLTRAVDLLCQASGVLTYISEKVMPELEGIKKAQGRLGKHRWPIETGPESIRALSMMLLADAHVTAIRKLLLPTLSHTLFDPPGPPLPSNHPSPSLLAKLHLYCASLYDSALASLKITIPEAPSARKFFSKDKDRPPDTPEESSEGDPIPELKRYLRKESLLASALARKWLGVEAGENGKGQKVGEALAWVNCAQGLLEDLEGSAMRDKMKGLSVGKGNEKKKEERRVRKGRVGRELDDIKGWVSTYQGMNDRVTFQPVPPVSSLTVPPGRSIFSAKAFIPPADKFGPRSSGNGDGHSANEVYAGKGTYY